MPERLATVSPISVPHPAAFIKSITTSRQGLASWYMYFFQLPRIPEWLLMRRNGAMASEFLRRTPPSGPRFEILPGVSHWRPEEQPDRLADLLLGWFVAHQVD